MGEHRGNSVISASPAKNQFASWWRQFKNSPKSISTDSISSRSSFSYLQSRLAVVNNRKNKYSESPKLGKPYSTMGVLLKDSGEIQHNKDFKFFRDSFLNSYNDFTGKIFGVSLSDSLLLASSEVLVQSRLENFGRIPVVVAKCGAFLKQNGLTTSGIFRIAGNNKRVKDLVYIFSTPTHYGSKFSNWDGFTVHDAASVLRRYLNNLTEPLIPLCHYESYREPLRSRARILKHMARSTSFDNVKITAGTVSGSSNSENFARGVQEDEVKSKNYNNTKVSENQSLESTSIEICSGDEEKRCKLRHKKRLIRDIQAAIRDYELLFSNLSSESKQLIVYLLDLLSLFDQHSDVNLMSARNLAAIFQPSMLSHPDHDMDPKEYELSRLVVEFLIEYSYRLLPHLLKITNDEDISVQKRWQYQSDGERHNINTGSNIRTEKYAQKDTNTMNDTLKGSLDDYSGIDHRLTDIKSSMSPPIEKKVSGDCLLDNINISLHETRSEGCTERKSQSKNGSQFPSLNMSPISISVSSTQTGELLTVGTEPDWKESLIGMPISTSRLQKKDKAYQLKIPQTSPHSSTSPIHVDTLPTPSSIKNLGYNRPYSKSMSSAISPPDMISTRYAMKTPRFEKSIVLSSDTEGVSEFDDNDQYHSPHSHLSASLSRSSQLSLTNTKQVVTKFSCPSQISLNKESNSDPTVPLMSTQTPLSGSSVNCHPMNNHMSHEAVPAFDISHVEHIDDEDDYEIDFQSGRRTRSKIRESWFQRLRNRSRSNI